MKRFVVNKQKRRSKFENMNTENKSTDVKKDNTIKGDWGIAALFGVGFFVVLLLSNVIDQKFNIFGSATMFFYFTSLSIFSVHTRLYFMHLKAK